MAVRGWGGSLATAVGIAAGAGAAQLGFGYGLGIIDWASSGVGTDEAFWVASLAWATWIAAVSTIAGAVGAQRLSRRPAAQWTPARVLPTVLAAGVGALVTVLLVAVPARAATPSETASPPTVAASYAVVGALVGMLVASWALRSPPAAGNVVATVGWIWLLAVVAVVDGVLSGRGLGSAQLGIWQITNADDGRFWFREHFYWPGALLSLGSAVLIGAFAARRAARETYRRVGAAASGAAGPLLVAVAYFLAVPRLAAIRPEQVSAHLIAPYAVVAGIAGSVLVAALAQRRDAALAQGRDATVASATPGSGTPAPESATGTAAPGAATVVDTAGPVAGDGDDATTLAAGRPGSLDEAASEREPAAADEAASDREPAAAPAPAPAGGGAAPERTGTGDPPRGRTGRARTAPRQRRTEPAATPPGADDDIPTSVVDVPGSAGPTDPSGAGTAGVTGPDPGDPAADAPPPSRRSGTARRPRA